VRLSDAAAVSSALARLAAAGVPVAPGDLVRDPSGNAVRLTV
jgi:hypothetical protein